MSNLSKKCSYAEMEAGGSLDIGVGPGSMHMTGPLIWQTAIEQGCKGHPVKVIERDGVTMFVSPSTEEETSE